MSFPLNPVNGQETIQNGILYSYTSATNSWRRLYNNVLDQLYIGGNYASFSTTTGALIVVGGAGIGRDLNVGGKIYSQGAEVITTSTIGDWAVTEVNGGIDISVTTATGGIVTVNNISTLQSVTDRGNSTTNQLLVFNSTNASNTQSGAIVVSGGLGVGNDAYFGGLIYANNSISYGAGTTGLSLQPFSIGNYGAIYSTNVIASTTNYSFLSNGITTNLNGTANVNLSVNGTDKLAVNSSTVTILASTPSTSTTNGALVVAGGVGIAENLFVGGNTTIAGDLTIGGNVNGVVKQILAGTGIDVNPPGGTGTVTISSIATLQNVTNSGSVTTNSIGITNDTVSFSTNSNQALLVSGGIGALRLVASEVYQGTQQVINDVVPTAGSGISIDSLSTSNGVVSFTVTNTGVTSITGTSNQIIASTATGAVTLSLTDSPTFTTGTFLDVVITGNENAISTITGSLQVQGGIGISESLFVKNTQLSSYRSSVISTNSTQNLDTFSTSTFRSIRYFIQIVDITKIHITEMTLFHDNTSIYKNEYGISTNAGELGSFDASISGGIATLTFVPNYTPTQMIITMSRLAIIP
jgi:hypothetical protein